MKAAKLTGIKQIELMDVPNPVLLNDNEVLIKMKVVGVCGSDVHYYSTGKIGSLVVDYPFAVGHEGAGLVEKVGSAVTSVQPGDRIVVEPSVSCGECEQCLSGRPHTCLNNKFLGCPGQLEGNLQEFIIMDERQCLKLHDKLSFDDGALSEPLSIGLYANKLADYDSSCSIAVLGFGPIGMSVMLTAKARGVNKIFASDKIESRIKLALDNDVLYAGNPDKVDVVSKIIEENHGSPDIVFECCGKQEAMENAIDLVKPGGKIVILGIPEFDNWTISAEKGRRKEITFINVRRQNNCVEEVLSLMEGGSLDASAMITHRFNLDKTDASFVLVSNYRDGVMKAMIDIN